MRCAHIGFERSPQVFSNDTDPITATHTRPVQYSQNHAYRQEAPTRLPHSFLAEGPRASRALSASRASSSLKQWAVARLGPHPVADGHLADVAALAVPPYELAAYGLHVGGIQALVHARVPTDADQTKTRVKTRHLRRKRTPLATSGRFRRPNQPKTPQHAGVSPSRRSRQRTTPAENCPEVQAPWRSRRPFPAKPPEVAGRDRGQCHGSRKRRRKRNMHGPNGGVG